MKIVAAAVHFQGITFSAPPPARHSDLLRPLHAINPDVAVQCTQGFLTDDGRFATRPAAKALVRRNRQATIADTHPRELFSEDLW